VTDSHQRLSASSGFASRQELRLRRHRHRRTRAELSVLIIDDGEVRVESAADCAGMTCQATDDAAALDALAPNFRIAPSVRPVRAGSAYASISHDGRHAGRGGSGA
jgi:aldehyde:ferredoxin oxidoreductase